MSSELPLLLETVNFSAEKHRNQRRKDPDATPYINHPIGTKHMNTFNKFIYYYYFLFTNVPHLTLSEIVNVKFLIHFHRSRKDPES